MRKKFLCILLTLAMVFTMMPMATGVAWAGDEGGTTVADILPSYFPKTDDPSQPPIVRWINVNNGIICEMCIYENKLSFTGNGFDYCSLESIQDIQVTLDESKYTASFTSFNRVGSDEEKAKQKEISVTFNTNNSVITSIDITGFQQFAENHGTHYLLDGNYKPKTIADMLPSEFPNEKEKGWINPNNRSTLYLSSDSSSLLHSSGNFSIPTTTNIISDGSKIKACGLDYDMEFVLENDKLSEIKIAGYSSTNVDGTYIAPSRTLREILPSCSMWANENGALLTENSDDYDDLECFDQKSGANTEFSSIFDETVTLVFGKEYQYELSYKPTTDNISFQFKLNDAGKVTNVIIKGFEGDNAVLNGTYSAPKTIADILPEDFPTSTNLENIPSASWKNEQNVPLFYLNDEWGQDLFFGKTEKQCIACSIIEQPLTKAGNNYFTRVVDGILSLTFHMDGDEFYCVEVSFTDPEYESSPYFSDYLIFKGIYSIPATVDFNVNYHGEAPDKQTVKRGLPVDQPDTPTANGYTFGGWYKDAACTQAWNFDVDTVKKDMTLYAKWIPNSVDSATISGNVTENSIGVPDATVELYLGTVKVAATKTNSSGQYNFNNVEDGTYNIVVTKTDGKTKTELVTIDSSSGVSGNVKVGVTLPSKAVNSKVEYAATEEVVNTKSSINQAVVGGLDEIAAGQTPGEGDNITIKLQVKPMDESTAPNATEIKQKAGNGKKVEFIDMSLLKQVNNGEAVSIGSDNQLLLTIVIPFDFTGVDVDSVMILRHHGSSETLTKNPASDQEGYKVDKDAGTITIYAMKFSDYAIAYANETEPEDTPVYPGGYFVYDVEKYQEILAEAQAQQALIDGKMPTGTLTDAQLKAFAGDLKITVRTENQARGIKVYVNEIPGIKAITDAGYTVSYDFYNVQQKAVPTNKDYKITKIVDKTEAWYLNTAARKGKKYYYKVIVNIKDEDGNVVAKTALSQCLYGCRTRK